ncbi:MAG: class I SAM-dependent methyltransferase [Planctomycetes bacterium]|nr:class I SAM-dependent methyltransferase [Planctomycetota bacterium]
MFTPANAPVDSSTGDAEPASETHRHPHPSRLFTIATLFGLSPLPVETARVLELGCGAGANLIPMAEVLPRATFIGIDLSAHQVARGHAQTEQLGLTNVDLRHANILDVDPSFGAFDYVLCHGVFSWVAPDVQEKIFDVCAKHLAPNGVAYVSYNTYPGWHMRGTIRDMMRYHAARFATTSAERAGAARALLDVLADVTRPDTGLCSTAVEIERTTVQRYGDAYLHYEHLGDVNEPLYFHRFVERASAHGLRYLAESRLGTMLTDFLDPAAERALKLTVGGDQIRTEQYIDFLRLRSVRETLLVHDSAAPDRHVRAGSLNRLHVASSAVPIGPVDPTARQEQQYRSASGAPLAISRPLLKTALEVLAAAWPATLPFGDLLAQSRERCRSTEPTGTDARELSAFVVDLFVRSDLVELFGAPVVACRAPSERPVASGAARICAGAGGQVVTRHHKCVQLPDLECRLLPLLDGTRDRAALAIALAAEVGAPTSGLDRALNDLARRALLVG